MPPTTHLTDPSAWADAEANPDADDRGPAADEPTTDGRSLRRERNREAVIVALLDLIRDGNFDPAASEIADRAGVSHRSVFRYFDDLSDLVRTAIDHEIAAVIPMATIQSDAVDTLEDRIEAVIESRLLVYNHTQSIGRVARARALDIPAVDEGMAAIAKLFRSQLAELFAPELDRFEPAEASRLRDVLSVVVGFESFDISRRRLERDDERIAENWRVALRALLRS